MNLYKATTNELAQPSNKNVIEIVKLNIYELDQQKIINSISPELANAVKYIPLDIKEKGRSLLRRENDNKVHWLIDFDHKEFLSLRRNFFIDEILTF